MEKLVYLEQIDSLAPWCEVIEASLKKTIENRGTQRNDAISCNHMAAHPCKFITKIEIA